MTGEKTFDAKQGFTFLGATPRHWVHRAEKFLEDNERRKVMMSRLIDALKFGINEIIFNKTKPVEMALFSHRIDESGLETFSFKATKIPERLPNFAVSILPVGTYMNEVITPGLKEMKGPDLSDLLKKEESDKFHFLTNATFCSIYQHGSGELPEVPLIGLARNGKIFQNFNPKSMDVVMNEFESGGIVLGKGELEILPFSELRAKATEAQVAEQTVFVTDSDSWPRLMALKAYRLGHFLYNMIGYFLTEDGEKRYFVTLGVPHLKIHGMIECFQQLDAFTLERGFKAWKAACLDVGGVFAGMMKEDSQNRKIVVGPSEITYWSEVYFDKGHPRARFFDFTWPKQEVASKAA
ncbi:MAG: hypothetical protein M1514_00530 [Patescibacteria group bacterium]|nr:hypothetical protein [Patescibacteria group bacterium]